MGFDKLAEILFNASAMTDETMVSDIDTELNEVKKTVNIQRDHIVSLESKAGYLTTETGILHKMYTHHEDRIQDIYNTLKNYWIIMCVEAVIIGGLIVKVLFF